MERVHQTRAVGRAAQVVVENRNNVTAQEAGGRNENPLIVTQGRGRGRRTAPRSALGRGRGRVNVPIPPPAPVVQPPIQPQPQTQPDLMNLLQALSQRLEAQEVTIQGLRAEIQQQRADQNVDVLPQVIPHAQPVRIPAANHIVAAPPQPDLYERFRRMRAADFEGSSDPLVADEWLSGLQVILDFMNLTDQEKVKCASFVLKKDARYWWETIVLRRDVN